MSGIRIGTIAGIPIRLHPSLLIALPLLAYLFTQQFSSAARLAGVPPGQLSGTRWLWGLGVALGLFLSVLLHELGHSLYARARGGRIREITLLMIGGVSQMSEPPRRSGDEAVMAAIGPVVSLGLAGVFFLLHWLLPIRSFNFRFALFYLGGLNLILGLFNLLAAFPMDGGRLLRAALVGRLGVVRATAIASQVGKAFAVLFGLWGVVTFNVWLMLIAFFVFVGAESESQGVVAKVLLGQLRVRDVMNTRVVTVPAEVSVHEAAERMLRERRMVLGVTEAGAPLGVLTLQAVQKVPLDQRQSTKVREITVPTAPLAPSDEATKALRLMGESNVPQVGVAEGSRLVGTVGREEIFQSLRLSELEATQHPHPERLRHVADSAG